MIHPDLRPLGIGEILDRAVTLFVRRFAVLLLVVALVAIPVAICQYVAAPQLTGVMDDLRTVLAVPPGHTAEQSRALAQFIAHNSVGQWGVALVFVSSILGILSGTACVIAIAQAYAGQLPSVREVYRVALRRWVPQFVAIVAFVAIGIAFFFIGTIAVVFIALSIGALGVVSRPGALVVGIPIGVIVTLVFFIVIALLYLAAQMSFISIALEEPNPIRGIAHGFRRTLGRPILVRSLLVAAIAFAVSLAGSLLVIAVAGGVSFATHVSALYPVISVIGGIVLNVLILTFFVIYSTDIRVRREGYDLLLVAQRPTL